jgi:hypothetical protein
VGGWKEKIKKKRKKRKVAEKGSDEARKKAKKGIKKKEKYVLNILVFVRLLFVLNNLKN